MQAWQQRLINTVKYQLCDHVSLTEIDGEAILLDMDTGTFFGLNHVGAQFLSALQANQTYETASSNVAKHYQVNLVTASSDLKILLNQLLDENLIQERA